MEIDLRRCRLAFIMATGLIAAATSASAQQIVAKYSTPTINDVVHDGMKALKERVEKRTQGKLRIDIYPASQLGAIPRVVEGAQLGTIELVTVPAEFLIGLDSRFGVISAPGVFQDRMHGYLTLHDPEFKKAYWTLGQNKGIQLFSIQCNAEAITILRRQVRGIDDLKGLKIRTYPSAIEREAYKRLGSTVAPMPLDEVVSGLAQGVIDGAKGGASVYVGFKAYSTAKYMLRTKDTLVCPLHFANKEWWDKLPADIRAAMVEEADKNDLENQKHSITGDDGAIANWGKLGGEVIELPANEQQRLRETMAGVGEAALSTDAPALEMYRLMVKVAERHRSKQ
jgi:TRAP-type C4-dicarboxylate transport system substrate-binding protein